MIKNSIVVLATAVLAFSVVFQQQAQEVSAALSEHVGTLNQAPDFRISRRVAISVPDKTIMDSFYLAAKLTVDMRRKAYQHFQKDGWLSVADGTNNPSASYDPRDFHFGPKCAAYLWGDDPGLMSEMGKRIFFDEHDQDGHLIWDHTRLQSAIHIFPNISVTLTGIGLSPTVGVVCSPSSKRPSPSTTRTIAA